MRTVWITALVVISSLLTSGCGTILNLRSADPEVYGGVQKDVEWIMTPAAGGTGTASGGNPAELVIIAAEVGLSLVGDTLTLPLVIRKRQQDGKGDAINTSACEKSGAPIPSQETVSLGKPQPLESAKTGTNLSQLTGTQ